MWYYCAVKENNITAKGWKIFSSRKTISKEQNVCNNGIHGIFNMAAIIHCLPLNTLKSKTCKTERMNIVDFLLNMNQVKIKEGADFFWN